MGLFDSFKVLFGGNKQGAPQQTPAEGTSPTNQKKVLIVEDETVLADALAIKLQHDGFQTEKAENGQVGLDKIKAIKPDIVLLDLMMPVMDGKTMLRKLREMSEFKQLPVIVLTNAGEVDNIRETEGYDNASAFLIKSNVNPEDIIKLTKEILHV